MIANPIRVPDDRKYLLGCERCECGRIHAVPLRDGWDRYPQARTIPDLLLFMFRDGLFRFCDCDAGQAAARAVERAADDLEANEVAMKERVAQAKQARLLNLFANAVVPRRFEALKIEDFKAIAGRDPGKRAAIGAVEALRRDGELPTRAGTRFGILLWGKSDMGKTGLLSPLFIEQVRAQRRAGLWVQYNDLMVALRDFESGQVEDRVRACQEGPLLMIDDFGDPAAERAATDYARDTVFRIVDARNNNQLPTYVTTNANPTQLTGQFHERLVKRLGELCAFVEMGGEPMHELIERQQPGHRHGRERVTG